MKGKSLSGLLTLAALAGVLVLPNTSFAFGPGGGRGHGPGIRAACRNDVQTICPDAASRAEVHQCLEDHFEELSAQCKERLNEMRDRHAAVLDACEADIAALCPDAETPPDAHRCLRRNRTELSDACADALPPPHRRGRGRGGGF